MIFSHEQIHAASQANPTGSEGLHPFIKETNDIQPIAHNNSKQSQTDEIRGNPTYPKQNVIMLRTMYFQLFLRIQLN